MVRSRMSAMMEVAAIKYNLEISAFNADKLMPQCKENVTGLMLCLISCTWKWLYMEFIGERA